jgi:serralysin
LIALIAASAMELIGGIGPEPGHDNVLVGGRAGDIGFGDPFTAGNEIGAADAGLSLTAGHGGADWLFGDAWPSRNRAAVGTTGWWAVQAWTACSATPRFLQGRGLGGADLISGDRARDALFGDALHLDQEARGGHDTMDGGRGDDALFGDALELHGRSCGGDDCPQGTAGPDQAFGDAYSLFDDTRGGDDRIAGGPGPDMLFGDAYGLNDAARGGNDLLLGGRGDDTLLGEGFALIAGTRAGDDLVDSGQGDDVLFGDAAERDPQAQELARQIRTGR